MVRDPEWELVNQDPEEAQGHGGQRTEGLIPELPGPPEIGHLEGVAPLPQAQDQEEPPQTDITPVQLASALHGARIRGQDDFLAAMKTSCLQFARKHS